MKSAGIETMMKRDSQPHLALVAAVFAILFALAAPARAVAPEHSLLNNVLDGGGDTSASANYTGKASVAQAIADTSATSQYTFSMGFLHALSDSYSGPIFYVATTGNDTNASGSSSDPFKTIGKAMTAVAQGGTISIAAGTYAETVTITKDSITIIGADSAITGTILNFGDSDGSPVAEGIYAIGRTGLIIRNLRVTNSWNGINFETVTNSTIENVWTEHNGGCGIYMSGSTNNTMKQVYALKNAYGIYLYGGSRDNDILELEADLNSQQGVRIELGSNQTRVANSLIWFNSVQGVMVFSSGGNVIEGNDIRHNTSDGVLLFNTNNNVVRHNRLRSNGYGVYFDSSATNLVYQNLIDSHVNYGLYFRTVSSGDQVNKNNIFVSQANADSGAFLEYVSGTVNLKRNFWNTSDSALVDSRVRGPGETLATFYPFRHDPIDTSVGADSVAPAAPETVAASATGGTTIVVSWSAVVANEEGFGGSLDFLRYAVFRSPTRDTSIWQEVGQSPAGTLTFTDSGLATTTTYFYRVGSDDTQTLLNSSAHSDSIATATTTGGGGGGTLNPCDSLTHSGNFTSSVSQNSSETDVGGQILRATINGQAVVFHGVLIQGKNGDTAAIFRYNATTGAEEACTIAPTANIHAAEDDSAGRIYLGGNLTVSGSSVATVWLVDSSFNMIDSRSFPGEAGSVTDIDEDSGGNIYLWMDGGNTTAKLYKVSSSSLATTLAQTSYNFGGLNGASSLAIDDSNSVIYAQGGETNTSQHLIKYNLGLEILADTNILSIAPLGGNLEIDSTGKNVFMVTVNSSQTQGTIFRFDSALNYGDSTSFEMVATPFFSEPQIPEIDIDGQDFLYTVYPQAISGLTTVVVGKYNASNLARVETGTYAEGISNGGLNLDVQDSANIFVSASSFVGSDWQAKALKFSLTALPAIDTSGVNVWYVNDTSQTGDSFTQAIGYDTNTGLSPSSPFRTLNRVESVLTAGDTVYIDAGQYDEVDTFTIGANGVFLIGKDSASTVVRFDTTGSASARGIYATGRANLTLRDLRVTNARNGIWFDNVDLSTIERVRSDTNGLYGVYLVTNSDTNTLTSNTASGNLDNGIYLISSSNNTLTSNTSSGNTSRGFLLSSSNNNTLTSNISSGNLDDGFKLIASSNNTLTSNIFSGNFAGIAFFSSSNNNTLTSNTISGNTVDGLLLFSSSNNNTLTSNTVSGNSSVGVYVNSCNNNMFSQNTVDSNGDWAFYITGTAAADTFSKNVITGSIAKPDSVVLNVSSSGFKFDFNRNWWGTTDSSAIKAKIWGSTADKRDSVDYQPFRLAIVDTAIGADTVAPKAPDSVSASVFESTQIILNWTAVVANEEPASGGVGLGLYRVYRSLASGTSVWEYRSSLAPNVTTFTDSGLSAFTTYYYRVTAKDTATYPNESYFSDSVASATTSGSDTSGPNAWYVNDTSLTGDVLTAAVGADTNTGLSASSPFRRIQSVIPLLTPGDTIFIDAGTYAESVPLNVNGIFIVGADSTKTILDAGDSSAGSNESAIVATGRTNLTIRNLRIQNYYKSIFFTNVDSSTIESVFVGWAGFSGIDLRSGSDNNVIANCTADSNLGPGISVTQTNSNNTIKSNTVRRGSNWGIELSGGSGNTITNNFVHANSQHGIYAEFLTSSTIAGNTADSNAQYGIYINGGNTISIDTNTVQSNSLSGIRIAGVDTANVRGNYAFNNGSDGIDVSAADTLYVYNNIADSNVKDGIFLTQSVRNSIVDSNVATRNRWSGIAFTASRTTTISNNRAYSNSDSGLFIQNATIMALTGNTVESNSRAGIYLDSVTASAVTGNTVRQNVLEGISMNIASSNSLASNAVLLNSTYGIRLFFSKSNSLSANSVTSNTSAGIYLQSGSDSNSITGNTSTGHSQEGLYLNGSGTNVVTANTFTANTGIGLRLSSSADNVISGNSITGNISTGVQLTTGSNRNVISGNASSNNQQGFYFDGSYDNAVTGNKAENNLLRGFFVNNVAARIRLIGNTARNNLSDGFRVTSSSSNLFAQNTADSNAGYGFYLDGTSGNVADTFVKNNFIPSPYAAFRDSGVYNNSKASFQFDFTRNWWGTTDTAAVLALIHGQAADSIARITRAPFRLGIVDTGLNADTVAAKAPDSVSVIVLNATLLQVNWTASTAPEEGSGPSGVASYNVYRSLTSDTSLWQKVGTSMTTAFQDTVSSGVPYYYRVTSVDAAPRPNESFFSDSIVVGAASAPPTDVTTSASLPVSANVIAAGVDRTLMMVAEVAGDASGDTLTKFTVQLIGAAGLDTQVDTVALYKDADENRQFSATFDVLVANLTRSGFDTWFSTTLTQELPAWKGGKDSFLIVVSLKDTATTGATISAAIPVGGVKSSKLETGPLAILTSPATFTVVANPTTLLVDPVKPTGAIITPAGLDLTGVLAFTVEGDANDSLTVFQVAFSGTAGVNTSIDSVFLYYDADSNGQFSSTTDQQIAVLTNSGANTFVLASPALMGADGKDSFIVVVSLNASATGNDTLRAYIPVNGVKATSRETVPTAIVYAPSEFIVAAAGDLRATVLVNQATTGDTIAPINVDQTRIMAFTLQGNAGGDTLERFEVRLNGNAGDTSRIDYVVLYADANADGNLDTGTDSIVTVLGFLGSGKRYGLSNINRWLGTDGAESFLIVVSLKDNAPSGETIWAEIPAATIDMTVATDSGPAISLFAPAQFPVFDLNPPDAFSLTIPATNSETKQTTVNLRWNQSSDGGSGIGNYRVEISTDSKFGRDTHIANTALTRSYDTTGLGAGLYYWRVRAADAKGNTRYSTETNSFTVDLTAPDSVTLSIPEINAETTLTAVNFRWGKTATVAFQKYRLQIANDGLFTSLVFDSSTSKDTKGTRTLSSGKTFYWRVITQDTAGNESPSDSRRIQIAGTGPSNPALASPVTAHSSRETTIAFTWSASSDSTSSITNYQIQIDQNGLFTSNLVDSSTGTNTSGTVTLNLAGSFFWRVKVTNAAGQAAASTSRTFSIDTSVTLALVSPSDSIVTNDSRPVFIWTSDGDTFIFQLATDTTTPAVVDSSTQTTKSFQPASVLQNNTYFWRVNARDNAGNSETSIWRSFGIDTSITVADTLPPDRFYTVSPLAGACTNVSTLILKWNFTADSGTGVSAYRVQIDSSGTGKFLDTQIWIDSSVASSVDTLAVSLQSQKIYHWRVIAQDGANPIHQTIANDSSGYEIRFDTVVQDTVALVSPSSNEDTSVSTIKFRFATASDTFCNIAHYKIQIDTAGTFADLKFDTRATASPFTVSGFTQDTWYWRLAVVDGAGNQSAWVQDTFKVSLTAPVIPVPETPINAVKLGTSVFTFNWNDVVSPIASLRRYNIQITTDATFASVTSAFDTRTSDSTSQIAITGLTTGTWYWRVNAEDVAGNKSAYSDTQNFSVDLSTVPVPTISQPTESQVFSAASATFKWSVSSTPSSGIKAYQLLIASATVAGVDTSIQTTATSYTATVSGFVDATYGVAVRAQNGAGIWGAFSGTMPFIFDFTPPSAPPTLGGPTNGTETTSTIVVFTLSAAGADTGSGVGQYKFQASKDSAFDTTKIRTTYLTGSTGLQFTPLYLFSDTACTYFWRVATVDKAGNVGVYSETRWFYKPLPADTTAPVPIVNLTVTPSSTLGMLLSWSKSPSADMSGGGQYNIYWNNGNDSQQADSILKVVVDGGSDTYTYEVSGDTTLVNGTFYKFKVRAQDKNGNEESNNATVGAYARFGAASMSYANIFNPKAGMRIYRPGGVQVMANILGEYRHFAETITFQYRNVNNMAWSDMIGDTKKVGSVNPLRILGDSKAVYGFNWDAANDSTVADTNYELRALITDKFGNLSSTLSGVTAIELTAATASADQVLSAGKDTAEIEQKIDSRRDNKLEVQAGADSGMSLSLPANCMDSTTDTSNARVSVEISSAGDTTNNNNDTAKLEIGTATGSDTPIGVAITINLPSGQRNLKNGKTASISINYPAPDTNGFIPGTNFKPTELVLRASSTSDSEYRSWTWDSVTNTASTSLYSIDTTNRTITVLVTKFSTFLLVAPAGTPGAPGAQGSLSAFMVYPNPWRPNDGNAATGQHFDINIPRTTGIVFDNLPASVRIEVYNLRGERVFSEVPSLNGLGFATWNVQNKHTGRAVASGYYVYIVTDLATGQRITGKLAVIR